MKQQLIYLPKYQWHVNIFYDTYKEDVHDIIHALQQLDCGKESLERSYQNIISDQANMGLTFTNPEEHETLTVIGHTNTLAQFLNTAMHECFHIVIHITQTMGIHPYSEEAAYLAGNIAKKMHPMMKTFMCDCKKKCH